MSVHDWREPAGTQELRERLGALGWGLVPVRRDAAVKMLAFRIAHSRTCADLRAVRELLRALEDHQARATRKGAPDARP